MLKQDTNQIKVITDQDTINELKQKQVNTVNYGMQLKGEEEKAKTENSSRKGVDRNIKIPYKLSPEQSDGQTIQVPVGKDKLNPMIYLACKLYYENYLKIIYGIGKGYMSLQHLIYFIGEMGVKENVVRATVEEMVEMHLIAKERPSNHVFLRLKSFGLYYVTDGKPENEGRSDQVKNSVTKETGAQAGRPIKFREMPKMTNRQTMRTLYMCEWQKNDYIDNYISFGNTAKRIKDEIINDVIQTNRHRFSGVINLTIEDILKFEWELDIFFRSINYSEKVNKWYLDFAILDTSNKTDNHQFIVNTNRLINCLLEKLGHLNMSNNFLVRFTEYVYDKDRKAVRDLHKANLLNQTYYHKHQQMGFHSLIFETVNVVDLNIGRFFNIGGMGYGIIKT